MPEPYPHKGVKTGLDPSGTSSPGNDQEHPHSDANRNKGVAPESPKGRRAQLPPDHPSRGTIDEGGVH
jgi:hypothetical protein